MTEPAPTNGNNGSSSGWKKASQVLNMVKASQSFHTLRDMLPDDAVIDQSRLKIKSPLGEGAFAVVNLATLDPPAGREVAVKTLRPELLSDYDSVDLFLKETSLMRKLRAHPAIVELVGVGGTQDPNTGHYSDLFIVQEYCPGGSLKDIIYKQMTQPMKKAYTKGDALRWSIQIARALAYLHSCRPKVLHRDLKLDNVLLTAKSPGAAGAKLADFGLARMVAGAKAGAVLRAELEQLSSRKEADWSEEQRVRNNSVKKMLQKIDTMILQSADLSAITTFSDGNTIASDVSTTAHDLTGMAGSFSTMAPEVLKNEPYDESADIFSLGMVMFMLFHRCMPSLLILANGGDPEDVAALAYQTAAGYRPKLNDALVTPEISKLIDDCWSGVPSLRPTAKDVVERLRAVEATGECGPPSAGGDAAEGGVGKCCTLM